MQRGKPKTPANVISEAKKLWLQGVPATEIRRQLPVEVSVNTIRRWAKRYDWRQPTEDELAQDRLDRARQENGNWLEVETKIVRIMRNYASKLTTSIRENDGEEYAKLSEMMEHVFKLSKLTQEVGKAHERLLKRASEAVDSEIVTANRLDDKLEITSETLEQITKAILVAQFGRTESERVSEAQPVMLASGESVEQESTPRIKEYSNAQSDDEI